MAPKRAEAAARYRKADGFRAILFCSVSDAISFELSDIVILTNEPPFGSNGDLICGN